MLIFNQKIIRKLFSHSIIKIVAILSLTPLVQAAQFHLPPGTPGRQEIIDPLGRVQPDTAFVNGQFCEHVIIPRTTCHLYFPIDGSQPTTAEAGEYSGARYNGRRNGDITDWWVRVFGGDRAVKLSNGIGVPAVETAVPMGFDNLNNPVHIVQVNTAGAPANFEQDFWQTFRQIAADPVGRVLLYRLLIEIRREDMDENGRTVGCCENGVVLPRRYNLTNRNNCRSIIINLATDGCSFNSIQHVINFIRDDTKETTTLRVVAKTLTTSKEVRPSDIALFHEMLHWFHYLRNPKKQIDNKSPNPAAFKYAMRCYYGYPSELCAWGNINAEEIATILGSPNLNQNSNPYVTLIHPEAFPIVAPLNIGSVKIQNHKVGQYIFDYYKYLHGDDLSENTYRASRGQHMRFGHGSAAINPVPWPNPPDRFQLAYRVAYDCYFQITEEAPNGWFFGPGQAFNN